LNGYPDNRGRARRLDARAVGRKAQIDYDKTLYRQRHKIENMFGRLKDWRPVHTRYDRCAHTFMSAICIAATVIFWL
jgi:transposase